MRCKKTEKAKREIEINRVCQKCWVIGVTLKLGNTQHDTMNMQCQKNQVSAKILEQSGIDILTSVRDRDQDWGKNFEIGLGLGSGSALKITSGFFGI
jgi:hypothetical protein